MTLTSHSPLQLSLVAPLVLMVEPMLVALAQVQELQLEQDHLVVEVEVANPQGEEGYRAGEGYLEEVVHLVPLQPFQVVEAALIL
jgi:hypothetical protein